MKKTTETVMKRLFLSFWVFIAYVSYMQAQVTINLDAGRRGAAISPLHYGIFFEEINHAGEGGLYAELIRNRSFEENSASPDYWSAVGGATISLDRSKPLNSNNPTALKVEFSGQIRSGARNEGFWGMAFGKNEEHTLTFWARSQSSTFDGSVKASLLNVSGSVVASAQVEGITNQWKKFTVTLKPSSKYTNGKFELTSTSKGTVYFDVVSLFPPTFNDRANGCRRDLAQKLYDLNPAFMRFPGGCYVEGNWTAEHPQSNHFKWKETIGPIEERPGHFNNNWFYPVTDGMGMMEFLELCEDLECEPLFVVNMGFGHGWEDPNVEPYIQDALDAIEFCNGDKTTKWGKKRIELGHPEPFNLRLMEIGNENYFYGPYNVRYGMFRERIAAKYPEIVFIGDGDGIFWSLPHAVDVIDQHYYMTPAWFTGEYHRYDGYNRDTYKIYVGEYAVTGACGHYGNMNAAIGEAVFMCGMENNSDVVTMTSYAPIFCNENNYQWAPDIIRFNSTMSYGTPSYYAQQMMANNIGKQNIKWTEVDNNFPSQNKVGLSAYGTTAAYDNLLVTTLEGDTLYFNDFSSNSMQDFTSRGGKWSIKDGQLVQSNLGTYGDLLTLNQDFGNDYIVQCDAVKTGGDEGFILVFNFTSTNDYAWWNLGGWANKKQGVEQCLGGTRGSDANDVKDFDGIVNGQTYKMKVQVRGTEALCFLDGAQVNNKTIVTKSQKIYLAANIDDDTQTLYVKAVNPWSADQKVTFNIKNAVFKSGQAITLNSPNGADENTTSNPNFITPKTRVISASALSEDSFTYNVPAHGFCIFKMKVDSKEIEAEALPQPLVLYSFETADKTDDSGKWTYKVNGNASIKKLYDGSNALYSSTTGYLTLDKDMPREVLAGLTGDYSVSIDILPTNIKPLNSFSWAYGLADGTNRYIGLVNSPTNRDWYYEVRNTPSNTGVHADGGLKIGQWHNVTFTQKDNQGSIYIDGCLLTTVDDVNIQPSQFASNITSAWIARSPFAGDKIMSDTWFDDFQIFGEALSEGQVATLYKKTMSRAYEDHDATSIQTIEENQTKTKLSESRYRGVYNLQGSRIADNLSELHDYHGVVFYNGTKYVLR